MANKDHFNGSTLYQDLQKFLGMHEVFVIVIRHKVDLELCLLEEQRETLKQLIT